MKTALQQHTAIIAQSTRSIKPQKLENHNLTIKNSTNYPDSPQVNDCIVQYTVHVQYCMIVQCTQHCVNADCVNA